MKDFGGNIINSGITLFGSDSISFFAFDIYIYIFPISINPDITCT